MPCIFMEIPQSINCFVLFCFFLFFFFIATHTQTNKKRLCLQILLLTMQYSTYAAYNTAHTIYNTSLTLFTIHRLHYLQYINYTTYNSTYNICSTCMQFKILFATKLFVSVIVWMDQESVEGITCLGDLGN